MKKMGKKAICGCILIGMLFSFVGDTRTNIDAHPGRTNSEGCHVCRTNCAKWGLSQGEYHCHNGGASSSSGSVNNSNTYEAQQEANRKAEEQRKQQEELAKRKAEEQRKQQEAYASSQEVLGEKEGYNNKLKNPDGEVSIPKGSSEHYKKGYQKGYKKADAELDEKTKKIAEENASKDALVLVKMNNKIPNDVKKELYQSTYKAKFEQYEIAYFDSVNQDAKESAMIDVFDKKGEVDHSEEIEEKGRSLYKEIYSSWYVHYADEVEKAKDYVGKKGLEDGKDSNEKTDASYQQYKGFDIYNDLNSIYDESFAEGKKELTSLDFIITAVVLVAFVYLMIFVVKKIKKLIKKGKNSSDTE